MVTGFKAWRQWAGGALFGCLQCFAEVYAGVLWHLLFALAIVIMGAALVLATIGNEISRAANQVESFLEDQRKC